VVPKTRNATRLAVTPGIKKTMSTTALAGSKFGLPAAAKDVLLLRWKRLKIMMAVSKILPPPLVEGTQRKELLSCNTIE
jgi:hypothetical protein